MRVFRARRADMLFFTGTQAVRKYRYEETELGNRRRGRHHIELMAQLRLVGARAIYLDTPGTAPPHPASAYHIVGSGGTCELRETLHRLHLQGVQQQIPISG
jgi:hypothetical protein